MVSEDAPEDLLLIQRILGGDYGAFDLLLRRYAPALISFCRARLGDADEAEDAAQDVFLRAYRSLSHFRLGQSFPAWLFTIAANRVKTRYAARSAAKTLRERAAVEISIRYPEGRGGDTEEEALASLEAEAVSAALERLGRTNRSVAELYYLGGLSVEETAAALGIGLEAVKSRLFRARKELRRILGATGMRGEG